MAEKDQPDIHKNIHPPLVAVFYIVTAYLLNWLIPISYAVPVFLRNAGLGFVVIGFLLGAGALIEFKKAQTTLDPHGSVKAIVTTGVYRFTRNPIYLGFLLVVIGLPLTTGNYYGLLISPFFIITISHLVIQHEETYLERKFGDPYTDYKSRVRRWL